MSEVETKPEKPSQIEIERVNFLLAQVEHQIMQAYEAITSIRFGLAVAGFPVTVEQCIDHPLFQKALRAREDALRSQELKEKLLKAASYKQVERAIKGEHTINIEPHELLWPR